ncbi:hypothetical protein Barb4_00680 [Bacteroidales bacterium Barb4]|nr:hypothetical protein Barb4_00680 [Bacteroidales bacterium Barb4]
METIVVSRRKFIGNMEPTSQRLKKVHSLYSNEETSNGHYDDK